MLYKNKERGARGRERRAPAYAKASAGKAGNNSVTVIRENILI